VNATPRPLYPWQRAPVPTSGGWVGHVAGRVWRRENVRVWTPDRPSRSDSTYGLRYPGICLKFIIR